MQRYLGALGVIGEHLQPHIAPVIDGLDQSPDLCNFPPVGRPTPPPANDANYRVRVAAGLPLWTYVGDTSTGIKCTSEFLTRVGGEPGSFALLTAAHCINGKRVTSFRIGSTELRDSVPVSRIIWNDNGYDVIALVIDMSKVAGRLHLSNEMKLSRAGQPSRYVAISRTNPLGGVGDRTGDRVCLAPTQGDALQKCGDILDTGKRVWNIGGDTATPCLWLVNRVGRNCVQVREVGMAAVPGDSGGPMFREVASSGGPAFEAVGIATTGVRNVHLGRNDYSESSTTLYPHVADIERVLGVAIMTG